MVMLPEMAKPQAVILVRDEASQLVHGEAVTLVKPAGTR